MKKDIIFQKKFLTKCILVLLLLILAVSLFFIIRRYHSIHNAEKQLEEIKEEVSASAVASDTAEPVSSNPENTEAPLCIDNITVPEKELDFDSLQENFSSDIYAWILIPDTQIDYPILQHPTDNTYYLTHNLDGSTGYPGCIYTENYNSTDWEDLNTTLYGHNMKNGSMFAGLHQYEDKTFMEEHPYVYIYSQDYVRIYKIFAAYAFSDEHLYTICDWSSPTSVEEYYAQIFENPGVFDSNVSLTNSDHLITLSTCIKGQDNKRFLVQAVLTAQGETR